ncbi:MAG: TetR/AcrR family transcriptional regulator [Ruminococcus sp.]|nr:TetR/AcrR family transcriptional regulator [Ruminococcus sp.]
MENARNDRMDAAVEAAARLLLERDVAELKMSDIAAECNIGVASLYRYFGTKSSIVIKAACLMWRSVRSLFDGVFECDYYREKDGLGRLRELMKVFKVLYLSHKDFLRFLDSFDRYILNETVAPEDLEEYRRSILDFYPLFEDAYKQGAADGTLRDDIDFRTMYLSVTHSLMQLSEKFAIGDVFEGENELAEKELDYMIEMAIAYIRKQEELS